MALANSASAGGGTPRRSPADRLALVNVEPEPGAGVDIRQIERTALEEVLQACIRTRPRTSSISARLELRMADRKLSRMISCEISSRRIAQPGGRAGSRAPLRARAAAAYRRAAPGTDGRSGTRVRLADEVEHRQARLVLGPAAATAELLEEDRRALGRPQEEDRVDLGDVDALVEEVHGEERPAARPARRRRTQLRARRRGRLAVDRHARQAAPR